MTQSDAVRTTPAHRHQPPEATQGKEGTPARSERATPTGEAAENTTTQPTTRHSSPGDDPGHSKGHLTDTGRGRRVAQHPGLEARTPREHRITARARKEGNPTDT